MGGVKGTMEEVGGEGVGEVDAEGLSGPVAGEDCLIGEASVGVGGRFSRRDPQQGEGLEWWLGQGRCVGKWHRWQCLLLLLNYLHMPCVHRLLLTSATPSIPNQLLMEGGGALSVRVVTCFEEKQRKSAS
jgi:hypothetical protein